MTDEPPHVSLRKSTPGDDLERAKAVVAAQIAEAPGSLHPPSMHVGIPLRPLPASVEAKLANRAAAGLAPLGVEHPRGQVWQRVVVPAGSFAALDGAGTVVAAVDGHPVLAIAAAVLFVPMAGLAAAATLFATRDPLRLTSAERREITHASRWESRQPWTGTLAARPERALVVAATHAVERIVRSPAWRSGRLDEHRVRLDVGRELDEIDEQAFRIASSRAAGGPANPVVDQAWDTALTRVAALSCYADSLDSLSAELAQDVARLGDPVRESELMAGTVKDELAVDDITALTYFLGAATRGDGL